ncbi:cytochrome aa3 quinol oxidase subunit III [Alicyclobacillus cellulosilyticus]|uniref:Cytochrome aa3 quinol oxidase subunit III n=1 Tax=Alicyclobacillus cellulosilyticus TaxID=1003997 RepID=A0A917KBK0_9BACL|nr:cytochrome (ubi)quinol oxidase subunit III [Alicyclobacillus cellulosilyticus]GGJ07043.1 cytochrome aa3 quinol oxidase subunit III [Alicyclobacillus cellulosilyticus]
MSTLTWEWPGVHAAPGETSGEVSIEYSQPSESLKIFGFWLFLATDMLLFACLFATYVLLHTHTAGGPTARTLFDVPGFVAETFILLTSSFTSGIATYEMRRQRAGSVALWLVITMLLGMAFVGLEAKEFVDYVQMGATMSRSAFLSAFFTLVGTHGSHVSLGICWMAAVLIQVLRQGIHPQTARKVFNVSIYWHFLDVVWVFIFTVVYLTGVVM